MKIHPRVVRWLICLGVPLLRLLGWTWRARVHGRLPDFSGSEVLFAFLHGDMLIPALEFRRLPAAVLISQHGDGEIIAQVVRRLGQHVPVRGSSTRGGARAFLEMVKTKTGMPWAITPDGPRGPRGRVHDGVIQLAIESGRAIVPGGFAVSRGWRFKSWDRFVIPAPFARVISYFGDPMPVPRDLGADDRARYARELEDRLRATAAAAERALDEW